MTARGRAALSVIVVAAAAQGLVGLAPAAAAITGSTLGVAVAEVFAGGGGAYDHDYVVLFNRNATDVDLSGWSLQYTDGSTWQQTDLTGTVSANSYYLIDEASAATGAALPPADDSGTIDMATTKGAVALMPTTTPLTTVSDSVPGAADVVGWADVDDDNFDSPAEDFERAPSMFPDDALARANAGCSDSDDTYLDIAPATPDPRSSASPSQTCAPMTLRPVAEADFPVCQSDTDLYCVESFSVDGVDRLGDPDWSVKTNLAGFTDVLFDGAPLPPGHNEVVSITIRQGDIRDRSVRGHVDGLWLQWTGDATNGYTLHLDGRMTTVYNKSADDGDRCVPGDCGDATTAAQYAASLFHVETPMWDKNYEYVGNRFTGDQNDYRDTWTSTGAQYMTAPVFDSLSMPWQWEVQVGNVHLETDGVTPVAQSVSAHVGAAYLAALGISVPEALSYGINVTRQDGSAVTPVGATMVDAGDGGLYIRIPSITFSVPRLKFRSGGTPKVFAPDVPLAVRGTPLDGAATIRFAAPHFDGGAPLSSYDVRCAAGADVHTATSLSAVAVDVPGLSDGTAYACAVRAHNSAKKLSRWSPAVTVTPQSGLAATAPGGVQAFSAGPTRAGGLTVRWRPPASTGGAAVTGYRVDICRASASCPADPVRTRSLGTTARSYSISRGGLALGAYKVLVTARNSVGDGDVQRTTTRMVLAAPAAHAPAIASSVTTQLRVPVHWSPPAHVAYPRGTRYLVVYGVNGRYPSSRLVRPTTATSATLRAAANTTYRFSVFAIDATGGRSLPTVVHSIVPKDDAGAGTTGHWTRPRASRWWLGRVHDSRDPGATISTVAVGSHIWLIGDRGPSYGRFQVRIDHGAWSTVRTAHATKLRSRQLLWASRALSLGSHRITVRVVGKAATAHLAIDAFAFSH